MSPFSRYPNAGSLPCVNRYILIVTPLQPYVDWVRGLPDPEREEGDIELSLEEAQRYHQSSYLIPYAWEWEKVEEWCDANFELFFETELRWMTEDIKLWPSPRSLELFESWFEAEVVDAPLDTTREPMFLRPAAGKRRARAKKAKRK